MTTDLRSVATAVLERLRHALASAQLRTPVDRAALIGQGVRHGVEALEAALAGHGSAACIAILDAVLAERATPRPVPELVWTGPEAPAGTARDTKVVLRSLLAGARERVVLAGYSFDHAEDVLAPLHAVMRDHGVTVHAFVDIPQLARGSSPEAHLEGCLRGFLATSWPFGPPLPQLYCDRRALVPGPPYSSLHAKCVVVDGLRALVSSANFTQRGQERNIEVGVLIEDATFAEFLSAQWMRLVDSGLVVGWT